MWSQFINLIGANIYNYMFLWTQKSLPYLTEQIQSKLLSVQREIKNYEQGPPVEEEQMGPFLSDVRALRIKDNNIYPLPSYLYISIQ